MKKKAYFLYNLAILMAFFPLRALAYLDPGTGSMILQILGIAFIAIGGVWVAFKNRIKRFFKKGQAADTRDDDDDMDDTDGTNA